jgi:hypothetical protein
MLADDVIIYVVRVFTLWSFDMRCIYCDNLNDEPLNHIGGGDWMHSGCEQDYRLDLEASDRQAAEERQSEWDEANAALDEEWQQELRMEAAMLHGVDGWNDFC